MNNPELLLLFEELVADEETLAAAAVIAEGIELQQRQRQRSLIRPKEESDVGRTKSKKQPAIPSSTEKRKFEENVEIIPHYRPKDSAFKGHFRMERTSVEELQRLLEPHISLKCVPLEKKILAALWLLGNRESFREVGFRFDLSKASLHKVFLEVCEALKAIRPNIIKWPSRQRREQIEKAFLMKTGFPGVVGCISGTYIQIPKPKEHWEMYMNHKNVPSIKLQAICDADLKFLDVYIGWPGSVHDARVFKECPLYTLLENGNLSEEQHLVGDSAYTLALYMMTPFTDNGVLSEEQTSFNSHHSSTRGVVERAFQLLRCKFRRLKNLDMKAIGKIPLVITATCVLHNFLLMTEPLDLDLELQDVNLDPVDLHDNTIDPEDYVQRLDSAKAQLKRNQLAQMMS